MKLVFEFEDGSESDVRNAPAHSFHKGETVIIGEDDYTVDDIEHVTYPVTDAVSYNRINVLIKKKINDFERTRAYTDYEINALEKAKAYKYIEIKKHGTKWRAYLVVGVQSFAVCDETTKTRARWFADQLAKALVTMLEDVKEATDAV